MMYEQHWDLACRPFENRFSPEFFFGGQTHEAARLKLRYAIESGLGPGVLCGGIGTGKTAVAELLHHELSGTCGPFVHLVFPQMPPADFLAYFAAKLAYLSAKPITSEKSPEWRGGIDRTLAQIESQLLSLSQQGCRPTIVIDEAHLIEDLRVFQCLQLLLNFEQQQGYPFSLLLVGGTSLLGRLERMPQMTDRIAVHSVLEPLSRDETIQYVAHRLAAAGAKREIFHRRALEALCDRSGGVPRRINRLADLALVVGYADQLRVIGAEEIEAVAVELPSVKAA